MTGSCDISTVLHILPLQVATGKRSSAVIKMENFDGLNTEKVVIFVNMFPVKILLHMVSDLHSSCSCRFKSWLEAKFFVFNNFLMLIIVKVTNIEY